MELNPRKTKMNRSRDYYRKQRARRVHHNHYIQYNVFRLEKLYGHYPECRRTYDTPGRLAKGKVHCSCWICAFHGQTMQDRRLEARDAYSFWLFDHDFENDE